jgi:putative glutathione S-transferase
VPVLFDMQTNRIVNNESSEIIRMLNSEFNAFCATPGQAELDFYPAELRPAIDEVNEWVYPCINNGVYRCGFAQKQDPYEKAFRELFAALDRAEAILAKSRFIIGSRMTEADIRLFVTLIRFDAVYVVHFKTNLRCIRDYPNLYNYMKELYHMPEVKQTINFEHIKKHYFCSHKSINPFSICPIGPDLSDLDTPSNREAQFASP